MEKRSLPKPLVTVIIAAYNEELTIGKIVKDLLKIKEYKIDPLVSVDSKTIDRTQEVAREAGARVIRGKNTPGKGAVIKFAIPFINGNFVAQIDADYQFLPSDIPSLIRPLEKGYDITLGTRYQKGANVEKGSVSPLKLFGSYILSMATTIAINKRITDVMAGLKAFKTPVLKELSPETSHFGYEAEIVINAARKKYKILNVPIQYRKREEGTSTVNSIKHGSLVLVTIIRTALGI